VRGLVVVQHNVKSVCRRGEKDDLEDGVPCAVGECPEEIKVSSEVDEEV